MILFSKANVVFIAYLLFEQFSYISNGSVFYRMLDKKMTNSFRQISANSSIHCCAQCARDPDCLAVSVRASAGSCLMSDYRVDDLYYTGMVTTMSNWLVYTAGRCDEGWILYNNSCYYHVVEAASWNTSLNTCVSFASFMPKIDSLQKHQFIYNTFGSELEYWIGLTDIQQDDRFVWASDGSVPVFTLWASTEPNGGTLENCVMYQQGWRDYGCDTKVGTICEKRLL